MPKLSIIMPVYNTEKYLRRSIDSILNQTFQDYELIIVNDGSTDDSYAICQEYKKRDSRIKLIDQKNAGAGSARNKGLSIAAGDYIAFPDSDDWIESEAYAHCVEKMDEYHLDLLLFGSINTVYSDDGMVLKETKGATKSLFCKTQSECRENWVDTVKELPMGGPSNKIYRHSVIKKNQIVFPDIRRMQDGVFNIKFFDCIDRFMSIDECYYHFTDHPFNYQKKKMPKDFIECAALYHQTAISTLDKWGMNVPDYRNYFDGWFSETIIDAEQNYAPNDASFGNLYRYVSGINNNAYVRSFFSEYVKQRGRHRKKEIAIYLRLNFIISIAIRMRRQ